MARKYRMHPARRTMLKTALAAGALAALGPWSSRPARARAYLPGVTLDPASIPQFVTPLPNPLAAAFRFDLSGVPTIGMAQTSWQILPSGPATVVWGFSGSAQAAGFPQTTFPGRTFEVHAGQPLQVQWRNDLPVNPRPGARHLLPVDTTLHLADLRAGPAVVPHLHGGDTESDSDGLPDNWWAPGEAAVGPGFAKSLYVYDNSQQAATLWYHDHALGITRLNVYAGLAGFYILRDSFDTGLPDNPLSLPPSPYDIPLAIQDRIFDEGNQLFYPSHPELAESLFGPADYPNPSIFAEFFGDVIIVNGKAWPKLQVEPRKYRLRILNGSDTRFYDLYFESGVPALKLGFTQVGTDQGLLNAPLATPRISVAPGERLDVVVDFSAFVGQTLILRNNAPGTFRRPLVLQPQTTGRIMAFEVSLPFNRDLPDPPLPATLRGGANQPPVISLAPELAKVSSTRRVFLYEDTDSRGRLKPMLGTAEGPLDFHAPATETPALGSTELWEIFNTTPDTHPIHLHLVKFLVVNRQRFIARRFEPGEERTARIDLQGQPRPPDATEAGWKDTVQVPPGQVVRIVATFNRPGRYVWHCHILSHEDHEMMRPYLVQ
jgi:spore coat protein A